MTSVLERPAAHSFSDQFVGRKYVQLVLVLGALSAIGPLTIDTYLPALPELTAYVNVLPVNAAFTRPRTARLPPRRRSAGNPDPESDT